MAVQETNHHDATPRIACALPLVDFDWKLKYAVASATIAAVNKPLLRLELYVSKALSKVEELGLGTTVYSENQIQPFVAEFSKAQLDALLETMDAIEQGLSGADSPADAVRIWGKNTRILPRAAAEADRIASIAGKNLRQVLLSLRNCLDVIHKTKRMLEVDPACMRSLSKQWRASIVSPSFQNAFGTTTARSFE